MSTETGGGSGTSVAERSPSRDVLKGLDKELEVTRAMTPAVARVLAGSAVGPDRFGPKNTTSLGVSEKDAITKLSPDGLVYDAAERVSLESRGKTTESYDDWKRGTEKWINAAKAAKVHWEEKDNLRVHALQQVGAIGEAGNADVDTFYNKYLKGKSDIQGFITDLSSLCVDEGSDVVDLGKLRAYLDAVQPLLKVFGEEHRADLMVRDFAVSRALLTQPPEERQYVVGQAGDQILNAVPDTEGESRYLKALARHAKELAVPPTPTPGSPTPPSTQPSVDRRATPEGDLPPGVSETEEKVGDYAAAKTIKHEKTSDPTKPHEDRYVFVPDRGLFAVLDGLGGHGNGDIAAQLGKDFLTDAARFIPTDLSFEETQDRVLRLALETNQYVQEEAIKLKSDMGATLSLGYVWESSSGERKLITVNLGDSRIYRLRNGTLELLTDDDTGLTLDEQEILDNIDTVADYTALPQKLKDYFNNRNNVGSALNIKFPKVLVSSFDVQDDDSYLITSDGIHDNLTRTHIAQIMRDNSDPSTAANVLVEESRKKAKKDRSETVRAKPDDMTAVVFKMTSSFPQRASADIPQQGGTGIFTERIDLVGQHDQLIDSEQTRLGRPLTSEEMYYLINGHEPASMDRFIQLLPEVERARKNRDSYYQRIKNLHDNYHQAITSSIGDVWGQNESEVEANLLKYIEDASITFTDLEDMLLVLKVFVGATDEQIEDARRTFGQMVQNTPLQQGETLQYILYFAKDNDDVTQKILGLRRLPANYGSLPVGQRLKSLVDTLYRPNIK